MRGLRVVGLVALACLAGSIGLPTASGPPAAAMLGCFADDCTPFRGEVRPEQGRMIDANTWESTAPDGTWTEFKGGQYVYFYADFGGRVPYDWSLHLSVSANPVQDGNNTTPAAGNVVLVSQPGPNQIAVTNATCSRYFIRAVLYAAPFPPPPPDAGDADAGDAGDPDASEIEAGLLDASDVSDADGD